MVPSIIIAILLTSCMTFPTAHCQLKYIYGQVPLEEEHFYPDKRNILKWVQSYVQKPLDINYITGDEVYNTQTESNCKEVIQDIVAENHFPGIIKHEFCINIHNPELKTCRHKDLVCQQRMEKIYILHKEGQHCKKPIEMYRPAGCRCDFRYGA